MMGVRVVAPHFVAGLVLNSKGIVVEAAPILQWCYGKPYGELRPIFKKRGWKAERCDGQPGEPARRGSVLVNGVPTPPRVAARAFAARMLEIAEKHHGDFYDDDNWDEP